MTIDLSEIKDAQTVFDGSIPAEEFDFENESLKLKSAVEVKGTVTKQSAQTLLAGEIDAAAEIECSRCLQPIERNLKIPFRAAFVVPEFFTQAAEAEIRADDLEVSVFDGRRIDLTELAREQILLESSAQVFCREDCKGLCQKCGANKNLLDCSCEEKEVDPRWSALKNLK